MSAAIDPSLVQDQALQLLDHVPGATLVLDPETGTVLFANQALGPLMDVDPEALVGQPIAALDRDIGEDLDWGQRVQRLREAGEGTLRRTLRSPDGRTLPVEVRARLVVIADTEVILATLTDASETQRLNADLGERVKELTLLHRVSGLTHAWGDTTEALFQEVAEAIPPSWQYPEITEARISYGDTVVATDRFQEGVTQIEAAFETSDGTPVHVEVAYTEPRPSAHEGPFLAEEAALIRSVTAILRAHAEHRLQAREADRENERLRALLDAAPIILFELDADGSIIFQRGHGLETVGREEGELIGLRIDDLYPDREDLLDHLDALRDGRPVEATLPVRGRWLHIRTRPRFDDEGAIEGATGIALDVTDQHDALVALGQSERRFELAAEAASDVIWEWDAETDQLRWSDTYADRFGEDPDEVTTFEAWSQRVHPDDRADVVAGIEAWLEGDQRTWSDTYRLQRGDGTYAHIEDRGAVVRDETGTPLRVVGALVDRSDEVEAEQALRESEQRFRELAETVEDIFWSVSADGDLAYIGPGFERLTGLPGDSPLDVEQAIDACHPEDVLELEAWLKRLVTGESDHESLEHRIIDADGEPRWMISEGYVVRDEEDRVARVIGVSRDVHDLVTTRQRLEASEQAFQSLVENIEATFWIVDADGETVLYNSPGFEETFGIAWEDLEHPQAWFDLIHPEDVEEVGRRFRQLFADGEAGEVTYRIIPPDGEVRWLQSLIRPDIADDGTVERFAGITRDITQEREAEALREESLLRQAEAEHYQEVAEFKTQFLNTAAHELSTPLTPLKFQVEALRSGMMGDLSPQQTDATEIIDRSVDRFSRLTRDLLDAARLQAGQLSLQRREIDLSDLIREVAGPFQEVAGQANVQLIVDPDGPLPYHADPDRLGQVLTNLVDNAIKFTPEGGTVTIQAAANGRSPVLRVLDTGIGMDPDQMAELFEPFTQVHDPDATEQRGTGLGLYISKGIVEQHGGSLAVASAGKAQGTTFTVHLPEVEPDSQGGQP